LEHSRTSSPLFLCHYLAHASTATESPKQVKADVVPAQQQRNESGIPELLRRESNLKELLHQQKVVAVIVAYVQR